MEWLVAIAIAAVAAFIAYNFGKSQAPAQRKINELENLVLEKDAELQKYKTQVSSHFEKTADMFGKVTAEYQALYQHMANSSLELSGAQPFKNALENQSYEAPPPPQLETEFNGEDTFSNESLYKAHEYRNQREETVETETQKEDNSADIIHLDKKKESSSGPALDYAIKERGVINHNSLNMENVKEK